MCRLVLLLRLEVSTLGLDDSCKLIYVEGHCLRVFELVEWGNGFVGGYVAGCCRG